MNPSLLIITGWAHGPETVQPMAEALSDGFSVEILTGAHVLLKRAIPDADFIVTGSMGGLLALEHLPKLCKKLVLISSTARFCATEGYPCGTHEKILKRMIAQLQRDPQAVLAEFFKNVHHPRRESRQAAARRLEAAPDLAELVSGLEYLLATDLRLKVPSVPVPVLLLHGAEDRIIPAAASEWLHAHLPDSRLTLIPHGGHALPAHHFSATVNAVRRFLQPG